MTGRYQLSTRQFILRFEDMPGLEVVMRPASVGKLMDMASLADDFQAGRATAGQANELFEAFADRLVSWNLDIDGAEVPPDIKGVRQLDADVFMAIFTGWFNGMTQGPKALQTPAEPPDLPMTALS